jgi:uncharacterized protein (TIGR03437 family)
MLNATVLRAYCIVLFAPLAAFSQTLAVPVVAGAVNASSYSDPVEPGSLISIFGSNLAVVTQSAGGSPLPMMIGGTSITVNGLIAPLSFVSPNQINAQMPSLIDSNPTTFSTVNLVVNAPGGSSPASPLTVFGFGPGIFTSDSGGCGQAAAFNVAPDGTVSLNSISNSAAPGVALQALAWFTRVEGQVEHRSG